MIPNPIKPRISELGIPVASSPARGGAALITRFGLILCLALLATCSSDAERLRTLKGDPGLCRDGTFVGSMTSNCPQPLK